MSPQSPGPGRRQIAARPPDRGGPPDCRITAAPHLQHHSALLLAVIVWVVAVQAAASEARERRLGECMMWYERMTLQGAAWAGRGEGAAAGAREARRRARRRAWRAPGRRRPSGRLRPARKALQRGLAASVARARVGSSHPVVGPGLAPRELPARAALLRGACAVRRNRGRGGAGARGRVRADGATHAKGRRAPRARRPFPRAAPRRSKAVTACRHLCANAHTMLRCAAAATLELQGPGPRVARSPEPLELRALRSVACCAPCDAWPFITALAPAQVCVRACVRVRVVFEAV